MKRQNLSSAKTAFITPVRMNETRDESGTNADILSALTWLQDGRLTPTTIAKAMRSVVARGNSLNDEP